jgi:hypothetical protein
MRYTMNWIAMPFDYDSSTKSIRVNRNDSQILHTVGTRVVYVDGKAMKLDIPSRMMYGAVYVPASYIEIVTGRTSYWNPRTNILRVE